MPLIGINRPWLLCAVLGRQLFQCDSVSAGGLCQVEVVDELARHSVRSGCAYLPPAFASHVRYSGPSIFSASLLGSHTIPELLCHTYCPQLNPVDHSIPRFLLAILCCPSSQHCSLSKKQACPRIYLAPNILFHLKGDQIDDDVGYRAYACDSPVQKL